MVKMYVTDTTRYRQNYTWIQPTPSKLHMDTIYEKETTLYHLIH